MTRIEYNKLVRDRIPEIIAAEGRQFGTEIMDVGEYRHALLTKLVEEAQEIASAKPSDLDKEIADLYEVIDGIIAANDLDHKTIMETQRKRRTERGSFENRIRLLWAE